MPWPESQARLSHAPGAARTAVLRQPELLRAIVRQASGAEHAHLQQVAWAWHHEINRPEMWLKRYGPAALCPTSRTLFIAFRPKMDGSLGDFPKANPPMSRPLGNFAGEPWQLCSGAEVATDKLDTHAEFLDEAFSWRQAPPSGFDLRLDESELRLQRAETLQFLLDRAFRMAHHLPSPTYGTATREAFATLLFTPCLVGVLAFAVYKGCHMKTVEGYLAAAFVGSMAMCHLWALAWQLRRDGCRLWGNVQHDRARARRLDALAQQAQALGHALRTPLGLQGSAPELQVPPP